LNDFFSIVISTKEGTVIPKAFAGAFLSLMISLTVFLGDCQGQSVTKSHDANK
jgi:hypothetical protein